jgi:predicted nucleotidyltransferase component of viral defense system
MLTFEQIRGYYTEKEQLHRKSVLVEYAQCELLDSIFKQKESAALSFIGGTAIRIAYRGNRFSEDLDFDNFNLSFGDFRSLLGKVVKDMETKGFSIQFRFVEKTAYHCYIKFPEILRNASLGNHPEEKILVRIDAARKNKIFEPEIHTLNTFDLYRDIIVNPLSIILSQKMIAILGRKREKGRDFYDVSFLWGRTKPDFQYIENVTGLSRHAFTQSLLNRCKGLNFSHLAADVEPFLIHADQAKRVKNFFPFIQQALG